MSSIVDAIYQIKYNPFKYGEHIASFYSSVSDVDDNLLLAPLVIPFCSHSIFSNNLSRAVFGERKKSTLWSIFDDRVSLHDLQERIDDFQSLTSQCIQYCLVNDWLTLNNEKLSLHYVANVENGIKLQKNAVNLGKLLSGHSVSEIYAFFGAKPR